MANAVKASLLRALALYTGFVAGAPSVDDSTVEVNASKLRVKAGGITTNELAGDAVTAAIIAADAVTETELKATAVDQSTLIGGGGVVLAVKAAGIGKAKLDTELVGSADGLGSLRCARFTFDPSANAGQRTIGAHTFAVTLPAKAVIVHGFYDVLTTFADGVADLATIAISVEGADDVVAAITIADGANAWDAGIHEVITKVETSTTFVKTSIARLVTVTVGAVNLTLGKLEGFLFYVQSA